MEIIEKYLKHIDEYNTTESVNYNCLFDKEFIVIFISDKHFLYNVYKPYFDDYGAAVCDVKNKSIIIDGKYLTEIDYNYNHLLAIEAHEIGHTKINVLNLEFDEDEYYADYFAYYALMYYGLKEAAELIKERLDNKETVYNRNKEIDLIISNFLK